MRSSIKVTLALVMGLLIPITGALAENTSSMFSYCWADGMIYSLIIPSNAQISTDLRTNIYIFHNLAGQRPVAEKGPGDTGFYNGHFSTIMVDYTPEGIKVLDPNNDGTCEFEITNGTMVKDYIKRGYLKITGKGANVDANLVSPAPYANPEK
jgi:hypothetical protein